MPTNRKTLTAYLTPREYELARRLAELRKTSISKLVIKLVKEESERLGSS